MTLNQETEFGRRRTTIEERRKMSALCSMNKHGFCMRIYKLKRTKKLCDCFCHKEKEK